DGARAGRLAKAAAGTSRAAAAAPLPRTVPSFSRRRSARAFPRQAALDAFTAISSKVVLQGGHRARHATVTSVTVFNRRLKIAQKRGLKVGSDAEPGDGSVMNSSRYLSVG